MRRAARIDANQREIVAALRKVPECSVRSLASSHDGIPDLLVGYRNLNFLFEVKGKDGKLTPMQEEFFENWHGQVCIVRSNEEALEELIRLVNK